MLVGAVLFGGCGDNACPLVNDRDIRGHMSVPATETVNAASPAMVLGSAGGDIGQISLDHGIGTIEVRGTSLDAVDDGVGFDFPSPGDSLHTVLATDGNELALVWLYCHGGSLYHVFYEGADGVLHGDVDARGQCAIDTTATPGTTSFRALELDFPALDRGFQIDGPELSFDGVNPGTVTFEGSAVVLLPFARVDCGDCRSDGNDGWQEMHSLLWNAATQDLGIGIFYFFVQGQVILASPVYPAAVVVPTPDGSSFDATWRTCN